MLHTRSFTKGIIVMSTTLIVTVIAVMLGLPQVSPSPLNTKPIKTLEQPKVQPNLLTLDEKPKACKIKGHTFLTLLTEEQRTLGFQHIKQDEWDKKYPNSSLLFVLGQQDKDNPSYVHMNNVEIDLDISFYDKFGIHIQTHKAKGNNQWEAPIPLTAFFMIETPSNSMSYPPHVSQSLYETYCEQHDNDLS